MAQTNGLGGIGEHEAVVMGIRERRTDVCWEQFSSAG